MANNEIILKGKVSSFQTDKGNNQEYYEFYVVLELGAQKYPIRLKPESKLAKELLATQLGLLKVQ